MRTMKAKMYLYYVDHRKKVLVQITGLVSLIGFSMVHVILLVLDPMV